MRIPTKIRLACYLVVLVAIIAYPVYTICKFEFMDIPSKEFLFRCEVYDPYDVMRGRYVQLSFEQEHIVLNKDLSTIADDYEADGYLYALLEEDADGFAKITDFVLRGSELGNHSWKLLLPADGIRHASRNYWISHPDDPHAPEEVKASNAPPVYAYTLRLPFGRYYLNEKLAPKAEEVIRAVLQSSREGEAGGVVALKVRILETGDYVVEDLLIDGVPLRKYLGKTEE